MRARAFVYSSCRARRSILAVSVKGIAKKRKKSVRRGRNEARVRARAFEYSSCRAPQIDTCRIGKGHSKEKEKVCPQSRKSQREATHLRKKRYKRKKSSAYKRKKSSVETNIRRRVGSRSAKLRAKASAANTCCICKGDDKAQAAVRRPKCAGDSPLRTKQKSSRKPLG